MMLLCPLESSSQEDSTASCSIRIELGGGLSIVSEGIGFCGRLAFVYVKQKWGCVLRFTAHDGEEGREARTFLGSFSPQEKFYEKAFMLSRILKHTPSYRIIASCGIGTFQGERLNHEKTHLYNYKEVLGFAYELGLATKGDFGFSFYFTGNYNSRDPQNGFVFSVTLGS